jgi:hypothetical protein
VDDWKFILEWYDKTFIPEVENIGKMLLIIDNAPSHRSSEL